MNGLVPRAKVCGLTRPDDAAFAEAQGAAYLGAILASGPRLLTPERARAVLGARRAGVQRVGVIGAQPDDEVLRLGDAIDLDVLQLHGTRSAAAVHRLATRLGRLVWPVVRLAGAALPPEALDLALASGWLVLDALVPGQLGGTGVALDWAGLVEPLGVLQEQTLAHGIALRVVLAGGLRPETVGEAIRLLRPDVVDVSSGVERAPGVKDPARVQQFVQAVHSAAVRA